MGGSFKCKVTLGTPKIPNVLLGPGTLWYYTLGIKVRALVAMRLCCAQILMARVDARITQQYASLRSPLLRTGLLNIMYQIALTLVPPIWVQDSTRAGPWSDLILLLMSTLMPGTGRKIRSTLNC